MNVKDMKIEFTAHAEDRMSEREVSQDEVFKALKNKVSKSIGQAPWVASLGTLRVLFEALVLEEPIIKVITVFHQTI